MRITKKKNNNLIKKIIVFIIILFIVFNILKFISAKPNGVTIYPIRNTSFIPTGGTSITAFAGNLTEVNIDGISITQSWQGFFGNVTGGFQLSDSSGSIFYNWSTVTAEGEVYASRNDSIDWTNIQCFNFTANGSYANDSDNKGATSLYGMNVSQLESNYNISFDDVDGVDETFNLTDHPLFFTNQLQFDSGECHNTRMLNSTGGGAFEEVLLYSPDNREIIYTSILHDNTVGFDGYTYDFEMLVLEDGHKSDIYTTTYYFYVELG